MARGQRTTQGSFISKDAIRSEEEARGGDQLSGGASEPTLNAGPTAGRNPQEIIQAEQKAQGQAFIRAREKLKNVAGLTGRFGEELATASLTESGFFEQGRFGPITPGEAANLSAIREQAISGVEGELSQPQEGQAPEGPISGADVVQGFKDDPGKAIGEAATAVGVVGAVALAPILFSGVAATTASATGISLKAGKILLAGGVGTASLRNIATQAGQTATASSNLLDATIEMMKAGEISEADAMENFAMIEANIFSTERTAKILSTQPIGFISGAKDVQINIQLIKQQLPAKRRMLAEAIAGSRGLI